MLRVLPLLPLLPLRILTFCGPTPYALVQERAGVRQVTILQPASHITILFLSLSLSLYDDGDDKH